MDNETRILILKQKCYALANANKLLKEEIEHSNEIIKNLKSQVSLFEKYSLDLETDIERKVCEGVLQ